MNREAIFTTLFAKLQAIPGLVTTSRKLLHWSDVPAIQQPALFMVEKSQQVDRSKHQPPKYTFPVEVYLYVNAQDESTASSTLLNPLLDAIETALEHSPADTTQTLGLSNVSHCYINGKIETDEGALGAQAMAIIPIEIVAT